MWQLLKEYKEQIINTLGVLSFITAIVSVAMVISKVKAPENTNITNTNFVDKSQWQAMIVASGNELMFEPDHFIYPDSVNPEPTKILEEIKARCTYWTATLLFNLNRPLLVYCLKKKTKAEYKKE
jgi:ABC-type uncharacterized transport system permease subunit